MYVNKTPQLFIISEDFRHLHDKTLMADGQLAEVKAALRTLRQGCSELERAALAAELLRLLRQDEALPALPQYGLMVAGTALCLALPAPALLELVRHDGGGPISLYVSHGLAAADGALTEVMLDAVLEVVHRECVGLSPLSPLAFKVLAAVLQKAVELRLTVAHERVHTLLLLVSASWAVPLPGVRESVSRALHHLLHLGQLDPHRLLDAVLEQLPWSSKTKYLLACVMVPACPGLMGDLVPGLLQGAGSPHLAPVAADLYTVLLRLHSLDEWRDAFLDPLASALAAHTDSVQVLGLLTHWVLPTARHFPEALADLLSAVRARSEESGLGVTGLLRAARRQGLWNIGDGPDEEAQWQWQAVLRALRHANEAVRAHAFAAVCESCRPLQSVSACEQAAARCFLEDNVSADSAPLRQSLLSSLDRLLLRARNSCATRAPLAVSLLTWLHDFLLACLEPGSNYQRRATALSAFVLVVRCWEGGSARKALRSTRGQGPPDAVRSQYHFGSERSFRAILACVEDPTDDIRETAAVILTESHSLRLLGGAASERLAERALLLCSSLSADCGALLVRLLALWGDPQGAVSPDVLLAACESQLAALRSLGVLRAARSGSPLHGALAALRSHPHLLKHMAAAGCVWATRLVELLEATVQMCLELLARRAAPHTELAPSFAEMGESIASLIQDAQPGDALSLNLSPAHQLVLSCIWLNLKACCVLASELPRGLLEMMGTSDLVERCADVLVAVLTRCRHKGAIEAAGGGVQTLIRCLSQKPDHSGLPLRLLLDALSFLEGRSSMTRKSAGLGILVHRLVAGDQRPHKPLVSECASRLLAALEPESLSESEPESELLDSPRTLALHTLRMLVADSSLRIHMAPFLGRATLQCLRDIASPRWDVRNAALQLLGALVPKLVGQRPGAGLEETDADGADGALEELLLRHPALLAALLDRLDAAAAAAHPAELALAHAHAVPALVLLSRVSAPLPLPAPSALRVALLRLQCAARALLSSPVAAVRQLAARALARSTPLNACATLSLELEPARLAGPANRRAGVLAALSCLRARAHTHLPPTKLESEPLEWRGAGAVFEWPGAGAAARVQLAVALCPERDVHQVLDECLRSSSHTDMIRFATQTLREKLNTYHSTDTFQCILDVCLSNLLRSSDVSKDDACSIFEVVSEALVLAVRGTDILHFNFHAVKEISRFYLSPDLGTYSEPAALPVIANLLATCKGDQTSTGDALALLENLANLAELYSSSDKYDEDFRLSSAKALKYIGNSLKAHHEEVNSKDFHSINPVEKLSERVLLTVFLLIQDENSDVREEAAKFVTANMGRVENEELNSYICLQYLLQPKFLYGFFVRKSTAFLFLLKFFSLRDTKGEDCNASECINPFDHRLLNIYMEEVKTVNFVSRCCRLVLNEAQLSEKCEIWTMVKLSLNDIVKTCNDLVENSQSQWQEPGQLLQTPSRYLQLKKCYYQLQLLNRLAAEISENNIKLKELLDKVERFSAELITAE